MLSRYHNALNTRPYFTKCWTSSILFGVGDVIAQTIERKYGNP